MITRRRPRPRRNAEYDDENEDDDENDLHGGGNEPRTLVVWSDLDDNFPQRQFSSG